MAAVLDGGDDRLAWSEIGAGRFPDELPEAAFAHSGEEREGPERVYELDLVHRQFLEGTKRSD